MPCYSEGPSWNEIQIGELSKFCLELAIPVRPSPDSESYQAYIDRMTRALCSFLKKKTAKQIQKYSLELQIWWRDHQIADLKRQAEENKERERKKLRKQALSKLTAKERKALGHDA